ncbi:transcriptional repressor [Streptomyces sp. 71268]|uniref:Fur family transcriptional regulator n=1 Tax=Streptomyces sp. 71268 TaxID=3002640 RepID=UPI0023F7B75A|nr:transcriptional repressor [Streptomyces sp. 71268]WEV23956.1 transcriptional repressor [Streptomyces sp. 71268]
MSGGRSGEAARADGVVSGRHTPQRAAVLRVIADSARFLSAQELHAQLGADGVSIGLTTVYRSVQVLARDGLLDVVRDAAGGRRYRHRPAAGHRHYVLCRRCGHSQPVDADVVEEWADGVAERTGFSAVEHTLELTGLCATCATAS